MEGCVNSKNGRHDGVALCPRKTSDCKNLGLHTLSFGLVFVTEYPKDGYWLSSGQPGLDRMG